MSQFIGAARPTTITQSNDMSIVGNFWRMDVIHSPSSLMPLSFSGPWWPRSKFIGDSAIDVSVMFVPDSYNSPEVTSGMNSRFGYAGVTRDVNNSPLMSCTVKLFRTSDDVKVTDDIISSSVDGGFVISTPYYDPHYIVTRKAGAPEVCGVSVSTIYPNV